MRRIQTLRVIGNTMNQRKGEKSENVRYPKYRTILPQRKKGVPTIAGAMVGPYKGGTKGGAGSDAVK